MARLYGIKNCDTMKKARNWLEQHAVQYEFHDYKQLGIDGTTIDGWMARVGWDVLLNKAGATFRALPDEAKAGLTAEKAKALMLAQPSLIKRPVLDIGGALLVGFKPEVYQAQFGA